MTWQKQHFSPKLRFSSVRANAVPFNNTAIIGYLSRLFWPVERRWKLSIFLNTAPLKHTNGQVAVYLSAFIFSTPRGRECVDLFIDGFTSMKRAFDTHEISGWVSFKAGLDNYAKSVFLASNQNSLYGNHNCGLVTVVSYSYYFSNWTTTWVIPRTSCANHNSLINHPKFTPLVDLPRRICGSQVVAALKCVILSKCVQKYSSTLT